MSTSDQDGQGQLTRKHLREIRLTGSTPVISEEEAAAASQPTPVLARTAEPVEIAPVPDVEVKESDAPLTRREMRALEKVRAASDERAARDGQAVPEGQAAAEGALTPEDALGEHIAEQADGLVSGVPAFQSTPSVADDARSDASDSPTVAEPESVSSDRDQVAAIFDEPVDDDDVRDDVAPRSEDAEPELGSETEHEHEQESEDADELEVVTAERPMVGAAFGLGIKPEKPVGALFDDLLDGGSSSASQHSASTALIFTPSAGAGSLSGPIASTGEMLITGTYSLPDGIGSQGHAHGTADGRDADAVLLDGELAPASSPTPIAASSAVSTSKSAGEVIRPPVPDKGNKLMLTLAIVAGGLALALAVTLIIAYTTGVFG